jgi:hypothetical protein
MAVAKQRRLFNFHLLFYYMAGAPSSIFNPHRQFHPSSLSTSIIVANIIPSRQLQPSSPSTSTLVAFQFPNPIAFLFPPCR